MTVSNIGVNPILVVSPISDERGQRACELIKQRTNLSRIINLFASQRRSDNLACPGINTKMQLSPGYASVSLETIGRFLDAARR